MSGRSETASFENLIDGGRIERELSAGAAASPARAREVLAKARQMKGLESDEVAVLLQTRSPELINEIYHAAHEVKQEIYGKRLVLFAPLYISNLCHNDCQYCAFRVKNKEIKRRALTQDEIREEILLLERMGHKRVLVVAGESYPPEGIEYVFKTIETIYATKEGRGEIRRVNANLAPLTLDEFKALKATGIGTYQLFQETYHLPTYLKMHLAGPKRDYGWRVSAIGRAFEAGINDVGIGVLFGLWDFRWEILAMLQHIRHLEQNYGMGPHTISVPRLEPAAGSSIASDPPCPVSDEDFKRIVAVLRLAVPYTGIIMSTRETAKMRAETFALGVSQISAGSRTDPGGYSEGDATPQFQVGDHRSLDEVMLDVVRLGYIPSFCTGCYRLGRTGQDFMELAKPGLIKKFCLRNAILTFKEYLEDYATPATREAGAHAIEENMKDIEGEQLREEVRERMAKIEKGERDLYF